MSALTAAIELWFSIAVSAENMSKCRQTTTEETIKMISSSKGPQNVKSTSCVTIFHLKELVRWAGIQGS